MSQQYSWKDYESAEFYISDTELQAPEKSIFDHLEKDLASMNMLDIGVGAGRTTLHFAKLVESYVGIDYSEKMIEHCKKAYADYSDNTSFALCDVSAMEMFEDNSFDFILFSYNGLDYLSHSDRLIALNEIKRVAKPGAFFCFSSHNLQSLDNIFRLKNQFSLHPKRMLRKIYNWALLRLKYNKGLDLNQLKDSAYAIFTDTPEGTDLGTYYIKPLEQIKQLVENDFFTKVHTYSLNSGQVITNEEHLTSNDDPWIYYSMTVK